MKKRRTLRLTLTIPTLLIVVTIGVATASGSAVGIRAIMLQMVDHSLEETLLAIVGEIEYEEGEPFFDRESDEDDDELRVAPSDERVAIAWITGPTGEVIDVFDNSWTDYPEISGSGTRTIVFSEHGAWRVRSAPLLDEEDNRIAWINVSQPLRFVRRVMRRLSVLFFIAVPAVVVMSGVLVWQVVGAALRPLSRFTEEVGAFRTDELSRRIDPSDETVELHILADRFNTLLDQIESAFERERRFVADASHELRTPLTVLRGQIDVTLDRPRSTVEYREALVDIGRYVERMVSLSSDLLLITRIESTADRDDELVSIGDLLQPLVERVRPLASKRRLILRRCATDQVVGDVGQLSRMFTNIIDNALRYSSDTSDIDLEVRCEGTRVVTCVRNDGPGIPEEHIDRIFDRFYRVGEDRSRRNGGAGLGLAIARSIAHRHGGTITVTSRPNATTEFCIELPSSSAEERR